MAAMKGGAGCNRDRQTDTQKKKEEKNRGMKWKSVQGKKSLTI